MSGLDKYLAVIAALEPAPALQPQGPCPRLVHRERCGQQGKHWVWTCDTLEAMFARRSWLERFVAWWAEILAKD